MSKQNQYFEYLEQNFTKILVSLLFTIALVLFAYIYINKFPKETTDYSLDVNIQDNFVLPPKADDKYMHYKQGNRLTVVNYYSLDCPYCRKLFPVEKELVQKYGDKVNFVFRDKPLSSEPLSYEKALIKECVFISSGNDVSKYFQFSEDVFKNYVSYKDNSWVKQIALKYIKIEDLKNCLENEDLKQKILQFRASADASQIFWTPTIVLFKDGVEVERIEKVWAQMYEKVLEKYSTSEGV